MKTYAAMHRKVTSETAKLELTSGQPKILEYLLGNEGSDQKTIAESCEIEPATAGSVLARMEKRGLIERRRNTDDRRAFSIYLSRHGKAARQFTVLRHRKTARRELIRAHIRSRKKHHAIHIRIYRDDKTPDKTGVFTYVYNFTTRVAILSRKAPSCSTNIMVGQTLRNTSSICTRV